MRDRGYMMSISTVADSFEITSVATILHFPAGSSTAKRHAAFRDGGMRRDHSVSSREISSPGQ
jgi:hypothetical protein